MYITSNLVIPSTIVTDILSIGLSPVYLVHIM